MQTASAVTGRKLLGFDSGLQDRDAPPLFRSFLLEKRRLSALPSLWLPRFTSLGNKFSALVRIASFPFLLKIASVLLMHQALF